MGKVQACQDKAAIFKIKSYKKIRGCDALLSNIYLRPISVAVESTNWAYYKSGIFNNCGTKLNHAVTLIGIKEGDWIIKNSWGLKWGESGFMRLAPGNTCGICMDASYP